MKKHLKLAIGLILNIAGVIAPCLFLYMGLINSDTGTSKTYFVLCGSLTFLYLILRKPLGRFLAEGRQDIEYDEFGRSKRKGDFKMLSRAEQDAVDIQKMTDLERILPQTVIKRITKKGSTNPEKELDRMIGLTDVKQKILEMSARMKFEQQSNKGKVKKDRINSMSGRHFVFYGSPGTGKTVCSRIIAGFLYKYGYIKKNKVIEVDGNFFKAGAETAEKVKLITQYAYDGVLFIDEAYILGDGLYGNEAVATLIKEMEDHRDRFTVILAGYTEEMNNFLNSNTGFKSRIKEYLNFPDYSIQEMQDIFTLMANENNFVVSEEAYKNLEIRLKKEKMLRTFGNGRTVRNILDEALDKHAYNYVSKVIKEDDKYRICGADVSVSPKLKGIN